MAAPIAAAPIAAATTPLEGFELDAGFEAGALALEDDGAADFDDVMGFALTLPEDLAGAGADITFFAGAFAATVLLGCAFDAGDLAGAAFFAGADFAADALAFATGFEAGLADGRAAGFEDFAGPFAELFEAVDFAGADFLAAGFDAGFALAAGFVGFFVCFAIVRMKT
jgi:hypothetical protein